MPAQKPAPAPHVPDEEIFTIEPRLDKLIATVARQTQAINELITLNRDLSAALATVEGKLETMTICINALCNAMEGRPATPGKPELQTIDPQVPYYYNDNGEVACRVHKALLVPSRYGGSYCPRKMPDGSYCKTKVNE